MTNRPFTRRQMAIVDVIRKKKLEGEWLLELDEIGDQLAEIGIKTSRQALLISVDAVVDRLADSGIFIQKVKRVGRGMRQLYQIQKEPKIDRSSI